MVGRMIAKTLSDKPGMSGACGTSVQDVAGAVGNDVVVLGGIVNTDVARLRKERCAECSIDTRSCFSDS